MTNPKDYDGAKSFPARLQKLVKAWQKLNEPMLEKRQQLIKLMASGYYDIKNNRSHTLNLIDRGVSTIVPFLVEGNPRVLVESRVKNYRPWAFTTQLALNYFIDILNLAENVLIPAAINSMFGAAITRTDFYYDRLISLEDEEIRVGSPYVELIDDSNYIGDPAAKRRCDFTFEGDKYTLPTSYAKDFFAGKDKWGNQIADYITADASLEENISPRYLVSQGLDRNKLKLRDYSTFIDIYLRDSNTIVTIMPEGRKAKILRERDWDGPDGGPYDYLGYKFMPESATPIPPAWSWHDIDITVNTLVDKMRELAENQKDVIAYNAEAADDMKELRKAQNMGTVEVANVDAIKTLSFNGIKDSSNWDWVTFMLTEQTKQGANPDVLAGRGAQAPTLGQEQLIYNNATRIINNMYSRYQDFTTGILKKFAWAFWTDPMQWIPVIKEIPGVGPMPAVFSNSRQVGKFYDFTFKVVPYSTQRMSPELQYQKVMQFMSAWVLPTMQLSQAQGAQLDIPTVTKILADYAGIENFNQYYSTVIPNELDLVNYQMQPLKNSGQSSDAFGALDGSRNSNLNQQQEREGTGVTPNEAAK